MKVLVFGGSGFLGSYVADELQARGHEVSIFDQTTSPFLKEGQKMILGDIMDAEGVLNTLESGGFEAIYNFAGLADINVAVKNPIRTVELNIIGNSNILEACRTLKEKGTPFKRFVFASSAYVFSRDGSFYGITKQTNEKLIEEYSRQFDLDFTIIRYGSVYGERADAQNRIYRLLKQAILDKKISFLGTGAEEREYIHARDAAKLSVDILGDEYRNQHFILTGVERHRYSELLEMIKEIFEGKIEIEYLNQEYSGHYLITPYSFHPTVGKKIVANPYTDFGQGLVQCIAELHKTLKHQQMSEDWLIES